MYCSCNRVRNLWQKFGNRSQCGVKCGSHLQLLEIWRHRLVLVCYARLAPAPYLTVLADARPSALLALAPSPSVLADARSSALLAFAPLPSVLADARPSTLLTLASLPIVLADARPSALLALAPSPSVLADACLLYTSPSPRDGLLSRMPSSA